MLRVLRTLSAVTERDPSLMIAVGASFLGYTTLVAAGEDDLAAAYTDRLFALGWTETHSGSDLLSIRTCAQPMGPRQYRVQGSKWLINNALHADFHLVLAKTKPERSDPRSLSFFLVPSDGVRSAERVPTAVLRDMVVGSYDLAGAGTLIGNEGDGLSIVQRIALVSRFQCAYVGLCLLIDAVEETVQYLSQRRLFGSTATAFDNVRTELLDIISQVGVLKFFFYRSLALGTGSARLFYGSILKSAFLLMVNQLLSRTLLLIGSHGLLQRSLVARNTFDSFVLPIFDGHYTVNRLITAKFTKDFIGAPGRIDLAARLEALRGTLFREIHHDTLRPTGRIGARPPFFDPVDHWAQLEVPLPGANLRAMTEALQASDLSPSAGPLRRIGASRIVQSIEILLAAAELRALTRDEVDLRGIALLYNNAVATYNDFAQASPHASPMAPVRLPEPVFAADLTAHLANVLAIETRVKLSGPDLPR